MQAPGFGASRTARRSTRCRPASRRAGNGSGAVVHCASSWPSARTAGAGDAVAIISQNHDRVGPGALARTTALPGAGGMPGGLGNEGCDYRGAWSVRRGSRTSGRREFGGWPRRISPALFDPLSDRRRSAGPPLRRAGYMRGGTATRTHLLHRKLHRRTGPRRGTSNHWFPHGRCWAATCAAGALPQAARDRAVGTGRRRQHDGPRRRSAFGSHIGLVASASVGVRPARSRSSGWSPPSIAGASSIPAWSSQQIEAGLIWALGSGTVATPDGSPECRSHGRWRD